MDLISPPDISDKPGPPCTESKQKNISHCFCQCIDPYVLSLCTVMVNFPAPPPLLVGDTVRQVVIKVEVPVVSVVQLVVVVQQFIKRVQP